MWYHNHHKHVPVYIISNDDSVALNLNEIFPCTRVDVGLKKVKLGIDEIGEENSAVLESWQLLNEKPPDSEQGVSLSSKKEAKDDLQVNAGDCFNFPSPTVEGPPSMAQSSVLAINEVEKEPLPTSSSLKTW